MGRSALSMFLFSSPVSLHFISKCFQNKALIVSLAKRSLAHCQLFAIYRSGQKMIVCVLAAQEEARLCLDEGQPPQAQLWWLSDPKFICSPGSVVILAPLVLSQRKTLEMKRTSKITAFTERFKVLKVFSDTITIQLS